MPSGDTTNETKTLNLSGNLMPSHRYSAKSWREDRCDLSDNPCPPGRAREYPLVETRINPMPSGEGTTSQTKTVETRGNLMPSATSNVMNDLCVGPRGSPPRYTPQRNET
jgi:hypothetical protein